MVWKTIQENTQPTNILHTKMQLLRTIRKNQQPCQEIPITKKKTIRLRISEKPGKRTPWTTP